MIAGLIFTACLIGQDAGPRDQLAERDVVHREVPFVAVFLPFGLAQAANAEPTKAVVIGGVQLVALATSVTAAGMSAAGGNRTAADLRTHQVAWFTSVGAGAVFVLSYGYGVVDATMNRPSTTILGPPRPGPQRPTQSP